MDDQEAQLRELMKRDAAVYRIRNQIAEKDPEAKAKAKKSHKAKAKAEKTAKVEPDEHPTEEPPQCTDTSALP